VVILPVDSMGISKFCQLRNPIRMEFSFVILFVNQVKAEYFPETLLVNYIAAFGYPRKFTRYEINIE
jgi:hypothetical protein